MKKPEMSKWFETVKRVVATESDPTYVRVRDGAPMWLLEAVSKAHQGVLPSDWVFAECQAAAERIDEGDEGALMYGEWITEHAEGRVDVYTKQLFQWATDFCLTELFADAEERAEDVNELRADTAKRLGVIQFCAIDAIARTMLEAFNEQCDEDEDEDETNGEEVES